jgi:hypothetical protein
MHDHEGAALSTRPKLIDPEDDRRHEPSPLRGVRCNPIRYRGTVHKKSHGPTCKEAGWSLNGQRGPDSLYEYQLIKR